MKAKSILAALCVVACTTLFAHAGVVTNLLSSMNTADDTLEDKSVGYVMDTGDPSGGSPSVGDVGWGLIRIDTINGTSVGVADHVFMLYSAQISGISSNVVSHVPTSDSPWTLKALTGLSDIDARATVLLFETQNPQFTTINFSTFPTMDPDTLKNTIQTLFDTAGEVSRIATFGIADSNDYLKLFLVDAQFAKQEARLSVLQSFVGPITDWKPLFSAPNNEAGVGFSDSLATISFSSGSYPTGQTYIKSQDSGTYRANYVPEPTSLAGLLGAGLTALGIVRFRRRK